MRDGMLKQRVIRWIASPRLAAVLMCGLAAVALLGVLVPQESYMPAADMARFRDSVPALAGFLESAGLTHVFSGWVIFALAAALAVNLTACTVRRVARRRPVAASAEIFDSWTEGVATEVEQAGWRVVGVAKDRVTARRGTSGFWGSTLLHVALLVVIVGGVASTLTAFRGELVITEGQTVADVAESYTVVGDMPAVGDPFTGALLRLDSMRVRYEDGERVEVVARMTAQGSDGREVSRDVRVNHPLDVDGTSYLLYDSGYAPWVALVDAGGRDGRVINLAVKTRYGYTDWLLIGEVRAGGGETRLEMTATPVPLAPGETLPAEELDVRDPRLEVRVADELGEVASGTLAPGERLVLSDELELSFEDLVLWNRYLVRRDPARWIVYLGFWMAVAGTVWRFAVPERRLGVRLRQGATDVHYRVWPLPMVTYVADCELVERLRER